MSRNQRIKDALRVAGISQEKVAERLNVTQAAVAKQLNKDDEIDSIKFIETVADLTHVSADYLMTGVDIQKLGDKIYEQNKVIQQISNKIKKGSMVKEPDPDVYLSGQTIRPLTVTVDRSGNELITYVPVKAQAGYRRGYGDAQYLKQLPAFSLPILISQTSTHRMFQVDGNSMRQLGGGGLNDGDVVICAYVEDVFSVKDGRVYVVITTEGVLIKRLINRLSTADKVLILNSDNKGAEYGATIVHPHEILEVWEYKAHISRRLEFSVDLWEVLNELQAKQAIMEEKLKEMEGRKAIR